MTPDRFLQHISQTLGRSAPPERPLTPPPAIDEPIARFATVDNPLADLFVERAAAAKMLVTRFATLAAAFETVPVLMTKTGLRSAVVTRCEAFERHGLLERLRNAGIDVTYWDQATLDRVYDVDVGVTDVWAAVAETGSVVVKSSPTHGRAASLVPPYHIAILRTSQIVPDLIDLMHKVRIEGSGTGVVAITGPSKTADIEMNLVTGVHGPGEVHVLVVDE